MKTTFALLSVISLNSWEASIPGEWTTQLTPLPMCNTAKSFDGDLFQGTAPLCEEVLQYLEKSIRKIFRAV